MMKYIKLFLLFVFVVSCKDVPPVVKLFKAHLNKKVELSGFDRVYSQGRTYMYDQFREQYPFLIVNYIDEECSTCKVKLREWYKKCNQLPQYNNLAYVFVFRGKDYENFVKYTVGEKADYPFFILSSEEFTYVANNPKIDRQIIDGGFLLDSKDCIKAIGSPLMSANMIKLIDKIVKGNQ